MSPYRIASTLTVASLLAGAAFAAPKPNYTNASKLPPQAEDTANPVDSTLIGPGHPGYVALKANDLQEAQVLLSQAAARQPNDAYAELNLGATYQRLGRMDLAEPLLRQAMTHGRNLQPVDYTNDPQRGMTVEQVACDNLRMGLAPAPAAVARPCQTTITVAVTDAQGAPMEVTVNTYFEFDSDKLTAEGLQLVQDAAKRALETPNARISLVGRASRKGTDEYNLSLSERRAETVRNALVGAGLTADRIDSTYQGESNLPVATADGVDDYRNRVVSGKIIVPQQSASIN